MSNIRKNAVRDTRLPQTAVELILCGNDTPQNTKKVTNFIARMVTATYEGTG